MQTIRRNMQQYFQNDQNERLKLEDEMTFNTLDWYASLIRRNKIEDKWLINHFTAEVLRWHEVFLKVVPDDKRDRYDQFTKLVEEIRLGVYNDD